MFSSSCNAVYLIKNTGKFGNGFYVCFPPPSFLQHPKSSFPHVMLGTQVNTHQLSSSVRSPTALLYSVKPKSLRTVKCLIIYYYEKVH